jgi:hypothetical protein
MTKKSKTLEIQELIQFLAQELSNLPDKRKPGNNTKYEIKDAVMGAFSIFLTQSPSFLEHQRLMKNLKGQDNALSLFNINKIPCDNQIRNLLDPLNAQTVYPVFQQIYQWLKKQVITLEPEFIKKPDGATKQDTVGLLIIKLMIIML